MTNLMELFKPAYKYTDDGRKVETMHEDDHIMLVESDNGFVFLIRGNELGLVNSYEVNTGINNPFEYITITCKLKRLESQAPELFKNDGAGNATGDLTIRAGQSTLLLKGRSCGSYIVSQIKLTDETLTLTAYTHFEVLRSKVITTGISNVSVLKAMTEAIEACGLTMDDMMGNVFKTDDDGNKVWNTDRLDNWEDTISIPDKSYAWRILQICAIHMGCRIFFTGTYCYVVNYSAEDIIEFPNIHLHRSVPTDADGNKKYSVWDYANTRISSPSNSSDSIQNSVSIRIANGDTVVYNGGGTDTTADDMTTQSMDEYDDEVSATNFCKGLVKYTLTASRCVSFTLTENIYEEVEEDGTNVEYQGFERNILEMSRATKISSEYNDMTYTNEGNILNLILTSTEMKYPNCTSKYTFGENKPISLDTSLSAIRTAK